MKHAEASSISFNVDKSEHELVFEYSDNGKGYPAQILKSSDGMGLLNIKNRSQAIGAIPTFSNIEGGGSKVNLVIALPID